MWTVELPNERRPNGQTPLLGTPKRILAPTELPGLGDQP